jgi:hypothetical protein
MSPLSRSGALCQASSSRQRTVPSATPLSGIALGAVQRRGDLGDDLAQRVHQVGGQVRPRGVPARPGHPHLDLVAGGRDRAGADAELAGVQPGVAVQGEHPADLGEGAGLDHVERAGRGLLRGLEDEPDPPGELALGGLGGQEQPRADQHGDVHVVAACVAGVRHRRDVGDVLLVGHRERIEVRAQSHHRSFGIRVLVRADIDVKPGALGEDHRAQARRRQAQRDPAGGPVLVVGELGVHVQVAPELDELVRVLGEELLQIRG